MTKGAASNRQSVSNHNINQQPKIADRHAANPTLRRSTRVQAQSKSDATPAEARAELP